MAFVEKRGPGRWRARYRGPDGRERSKTFERRGDADRWVATQTADKARGAWIDPRLGRLTFAEWVERWEKTAVDLRATTRALNMGVVRNHLLPRFGSWPLAEISTSNVKVMVGEELESDKLSNSAVRRHVIVLSVILGAAVNDGRIARNPCGGVKLPTENARDMRFLEPREIAILAGSIAPFYRPLVLTAAYVGLRWGELAGLRLDHVDLLRHQMKIEQQLVEVAGKLSFGPPKTKSGLRTVSIPPSLTRVLAEHFASPAVQSSQMAFPGPKGALLRRNGFRRVWPEGLYQSEVRRRAAGRAGVPRTPAHRRRPSDRSGSPSRSHQGAAGALFDHGDDGPIRRAVSSTGSGHRGGSGRDAPGFSCGLRAA